MTDSAADWLDSATDPRTARFYRLKTLPADTLPELADDFLLLDQDGRAHELFYPSNLKALAVLSAGESATNLSSILPLARSLSEMSTAADVQVWVLLNDPNAVRTNVAAQLSQITTNVSVLMDPEKLGVHALRMSRVGEIVLVQPPDFTVAYRGQLASAADLADGVVANALTSLVRTQALTVMRTPLIGPALAASTLPVPDYTRDVAPIFHDHCAICHRPGDVAPFALTNYETAASWAIDMKTQLLTEQMPPWHADAAYGHWTNSVALSAADRATLIRWIDAGAPRGTGTDPLAQLPLPPSYREWPANLGPPDALVTVGPQTIKAFGDEPYRYLFVQSPNPTNVFLKAAIILPSNPAVVHHYLVWTGKIGNQGIDGFSTYQSSLAGYVPGVPPYIYPADSGYMLSASNWLTFNLHYTPNGVATNDTPTLALWYHKTPPAKTFHDESILTFLFAIPPGDPEYEVQASWTAPRTVRLQRFNPHMHLRGKHVQFEALYPNGTRETLLSVPDYSFRWQTGYEFAEPKTIPGGTRIIVSGAFDNSPQNINNPDPTATVYWGDQTASEMFVGFVDYVD